MDDKVNLAEKLALLDGPWEPGIVGTFNDNKRSGDAGGALTAPERRI